MATLSRGYIGAVRRRLPALLLALGLALTVVLAAAPLRAQSLIRDAEIEHTLARIARPLFKAAGVNPASIEVLVVNDPALNAFVVNNRAIFLNSGLILRLKSIGMLQAVIGHELAHITSGHVLRRSLETQNTATAIGLGLLLGLVVSSATHDSSAVGGIMLGAAGSAINTMLAHTRAEETTADRIGVRYMVRAGIDPAAALRVLDIFRGQEVLSSGQQDPYSRTHPLSTERIRALKGVIAAYAGKKTAPSADLVYWHARMVAKFGGFLGNPTYTLRHIKKGDVSEVSTLTRAIAYHRQGRLKAALAEMKALRKMRPNDPYYTELKGQILLEGRQAAAAVTTYKRAVSLAPKEPLILAGYGRALLALRTRSGDRRALTTLKKARQMDPRDARMLRDLAVAWAKAGNNGMASLVTAERYALLTRFKDAQTNARRAEGLLARGSRGWLRAQDILATSKVALGK